MSGEKPQCLICRVIVRCMDFSVLSQTSNMYNLLNSLVMTTLFPARNIKSGYLFNLQIHVIAVFNVVFMKSLCVIVILLVSYRVVIISNMETKIGFRKGVRITK